MKGDEVEDEGLLDDKRLIKSFDDAVNNVPDAKADWAQFCIYAFALQPSMASS